jgi:hypothetical protein
LEETWLEKSVQTVPSKHFLKLLLAENALTAAMKWKPLRTTEKEAKGNDAQIARTIKFLITSVETVAQPLKCPKWSRLTPGGDIKNKSRWESCLETVLRISKLNLRPRRCDRRSIQGTPKFLSSGPHEPVDMF